MLTARAEHRLLLRHDNAALRLGPIASDWGLLTAAQCRALDELRQRVVSVQAELTTRNVSIEQQCRLGVKDKHPRGLKAVDLVRRGFAAGEVLAVAGGASAMGAGGGSYLAQSAQKHVEVEVQYAGYLERARSESERIKQYAKMAIPPDFDFSQLSSLLKATREHLGRLRPASIGQAARVPGVTPADLANLIVALQKRRKA